MYISMDSQKNMIISNPLQVSPVEHSSQKNMDTAEEIHLGASSKSVADAENEESNHDLTKIGDGAFTEIRIKVRAG